MYKTVTESPERWVLGSQDDPHPTVVMLIRATAEQVEIAESTLERQKRAALQTNRDPDEEDAVKRRAETERMFLAGKIVSVQNAWEAGDTVTGTENIATWLARLDDWAYKLVRITIRGQGLLTAFEAKP